MRDTQRLAGTGFTELLAPPKKEGGNKVLESSFMTNFNQTL